MVAHLGHALTVGIFATMFMDAALHLRRRIWGVPVLDYRLVGRWISSLSKGQVSRGTVAQSSPVAGEAALGWGAHYLVGAGFAVVLVAIFGWPPSLIECIGFGLLTAAAPFLILQPALGFGVAASKTPHPNTARKNTFVAHLVFGLGLYLGVIMVRQFAA